MPNLQHLRRSFPAEAVYRIAAVLFCTSLFLGSSIAMAGADPRLAHPESRVAETMAVHLADKDDCKRQEARQALVRIGRAAVPVLVKALEHPQASVRRLAAETVGSIKPPAEDAVPALIARLRDSNPQVRAACLEALRQIGEPKEQVIDAIMSAMDDESPSVRETAVNNLRRMGRDAIKATPRLLKLKYSDSDERVREAAGNALSRVGPVVYFYCILLVFLVGLVWRLFLRDSGDRMKALYGIAAACFGHPVYLLLALYVTYTLNLASDSGEPSLSSVVGYTTFLILLFLLRYGFFLYHAWDRTRSTLEKLHPYAAIAYFEAHGYCILGVLMFLWLLEPLDASGGIVYVPVFFIAGIAGIVQSIYSLGCASSPEKWAPPGEIVVAQGKGEADRIPLDPEDERRRRLASVIPACLGVLVIASVVAFALAGERGRGDDQKVHFSQMLAREKPGTAEYHYMLAESHAGHYPSDRSGDRVKRNAQALEEYNRAIAADPNFARAYKGRAFAYMVLNDYERAVEDFNAFERLSDVVDWSFYTGRARAYKALGMNDRMCEDYRNSCCDRNSCEPHRKLVKEGLCR